MTEVVVDATAFQDPLLKIAEVAAQKVRREGPKMISGAGFVAVCVFGKPAEP
jgi:hypothetical protein